MSKFMRLKKNLMVFVVLLMVFPTSIWAQDAVSSQEITIGTLWKFDSLDPITRGWVFLEIGICELLVDIDYELNVVPHIAESWTVSEDGLQWTFKIRQGVTFHDGTLCDAKAVKYSLDRAVEKSKWFKQISVESVEAVDDLTVVVTTKEPFPALDAFMALDDILIYPEHMFDSEGKPKTLIGTGPFKFESWKSMQEIVAVKNEAYWGGTVPTLEKVTYKYVPEAVTRIMMLRNNELDIARLLPPDATEELKGEPGVTTQVTPGLRIREIPLNLFRPPFNDIKVRKALNYAINREAITQYVLAGVDLPAQCLYPPTSAWANPNIQGYAYDPDKAKQLLAEAGWSDQDKDGIIEKDRKPFDVELVTYSTRAELPVIAEVLQEQLKQVGINLRVRIVESTVIQDMREKREIDMHLLARNVGYITDPGYFLKLDYHSSNTQGKGHGAYGYSNPRVDALIEEAQRTMDPERRMQLLYEVQEIIVDESPVIFLSHYSNVDGLKTSIQGYKTHPLDFDFHLEEVSIQP